MPSEKNLVLLWIQEYVITHKLWNNLSERVCISEIKRENFMVRSNTICITISTSKNVT